MPSTALRAPDASERADASFAGLSLTGVWLFITALLVVTSGYMGLRPVILGLAVHPYLVPMAVAFPLVLLARLSEFPPRVLAAMLAFAAMYGFSVLSGGGLTLKEIFKVGSAEVTIFTCALLVRKRGDFVAGALGLNIAIAVLAWTALQEKSVGELEVMEGANKNSYSLFALPAMLLAGYIATRMKSVPLVIKGILVGCTLPALGAIFASANRSGYVGAALVGLMLFWDRRGRGMLLVGAVAAAVAYWMISFNNTEVFDERVKQTMEGTSSDTMRMLILRNCTQIALENPIIGVSPQQLPFEIGRLTQVGHEEHIGYLDAHNVFAHIAAGSGFICLAALLSIGWTLFTWKPRNGKKITNKEDPLYGPRQFMRMLVVLWGVRGFFSREVLYNPSFCIAIGLAIGLCLLGETAREKLAEKPGREPSLGGQGGLQQVAP